MKKLVVLLLVIGVMTACTKVPPGYAGVVVNLYGDQRGAEDFPLQTGRVLFNPFTEEVYQFPTHVQRVVWTADQREGSETDESITFNSVEGATMNADVAAAITFQTESVPQIFVYFRQEAPILVDGYIRDQVREAINIAASTMKAVNILGAEKASFMAAAEEGVRSRLEPHGILVDSVSLLTKPRVDQTVEDSINAVIEATQRAIEAENKVRQAEAEAQQRIASAEGEAQAILKVADAQATANKKLAASISRVLIDYEAVKKWEGQLPRVTGGAIPFLNIDEKR